MYCIIRILKTQRLKTHFFWKSLRVEKSGNVALPLSCGRQIRILSKTMTLLPHPSTFCLWRLNPARSHNNNNNNNNNNGRLHACVRAAEDIEPFLQLTCLVVECESQQQFNLITALRKRFWFSCTSHFHLLLVVFGFSVYCLFDYSVQALCACSVYSSPVLVNIKRHL